MAGYDGNSMSNNARKAYADGKRPASRMVTYLKKKYPQSFRGLTTDLFYKVMGYLGQEYHHTSSKYNKTQFYDLRIVFDNRRELKLECAKKVDKKNIKAQFKRVGRKYIVDNGEVWVEVSCFTGSEEMTEAAIQTLKMDDESYNSIVEKHEARIKKMLEESRKLKGF